MKLLIYFCCFTSIFCFNPHTYSQNYFPALPGDAYMFSSYSSNSSGGTPVISKSLLNFTCIQNTHNGRNYVNFLNKEYYYDTLSNILYIYRPSGDKLAVDFNRMNGDSALFYYDLADTTYLYGITRTNIYFAGSYRNIFTIENTKSYTGYYGFPWFIKILKYRFAEGIGEIEHLSYSSGAYQPGPTSTNINIRTLLTLTRGEEVYNYFNPPGLTVSVPTVGTAQLSWVDNQNFEDSFELERRAFWDSGFVSYKSFPPNSIFFIDTVTSGKSYSYRFRTRYFNVYSIADTANINVIIQPVNAIAYNLGNLKIKINWGYTSVCDSFALFRTSRWKNTGAWSEFTKVSVFDGNTLTFTDSLLTAGYQYRYGICSYYQGMASPLTLSNYCYPGFPLSPPADFTAEINEYEAVRLNWREVNPYGNIEYTLTRKRIDTAGTVILAEHLTDTVFTDESIIQNKTFLYLIKATVGNTNSVLSSDTIGIPAFIPITPPLAVIAEIIEDDKVLVSWTDNSSNEKYFDIGRGNTPEDIHIIDSVGYNSTSYVDPDPMLTGNNKELYYSVRGRNAHSHSDWNVTIVTGLSDSEINKYNYELSQNYPNPFNPVTIIKFSTAAAGKVRLVVYDILGKETAELVNEEKPAGKYQVEWDATAYSSGVYFYRLQAGEFDVTRKLLLIK